MFERLGRLKMNGQVRGYSDLSRLVEIEGMLTLAQARKLMWQALKESQAATMVGIDVDRLIVESDHQIKRLSDFRSEAARIALV